jgi:protein-export membrane protein SecD/preprotein translocase SecF subunit
MRNRWNIAMMALITALTLFSMAVVWPGWPKRYLPDFIDYPEGPIIEIANREAMKLGLDLAGGTRVLLEADTSKLPPGTDVDQALDDAKEIIERRINAIGVGETEISRQGKNRLSVQLPGISQEQAAELIGKTAVLEFRQPKITEGSPPQIVCVTADGTEFNVPIQGGFTEQTLPDGSREARCTGASGETGTVVWQPATGVDSGGTARVLTGAFLNRDKVDVITGTQGCLPACVSIEFRGQGSLLFEQVTGRLAPNQLPLAIFLDEEMIGAPAVQSTISNGQSIITGLDIDEAKTLRIQLKEGALPVPMKEISSTGIDATLGENTLVKTVQAGLIGILAVMAFMILYYRLPGLIASAALITYISLVLMIFKLFPGEPVTITLAGIAGFVLSVGMAVDANVLVFERMKDELRAGRSLASAIDHGFDRAWSSIRDSNVSTLITSLILLWFGDRFDADPVKGFAITLAIGVVVSMFSAIVVTRTYLRLMVGSPAAKYLWLFVPDLGRKEVRPAGAQTRGFGFDFVRRRGLYFLISAVILVPGIISLIIPPSLKPGIEFSSGAEITAQFADTSVDQNDVRDAMAELGHDEARVQRTSGGSFIIRLDELEGESGPPIGPAPPGGDEVIRQGLIERFGPLVNSIEQETNAFQNFSTVSEIVSREIARNAAIAIAFAAVAILAYISWSFRNVPKAYRYGIAAIVAALHDAIFIIGAFSILGKVFGMEINKDFIAGLLTVIGFSVHDTIVVFDRIRENVSRYPDAPFDEVVNASLTETVVRSINTSFTVVITLVALLLLGAGGIDELLITLLLGIIAGTYSSVFIASQIVVAWEDGDFERLWHRFFPGRRVPAEAPG